MECEVVFVVGGMWCGWGFGGWVWCIVGRWGGEEKNVYVCKEIFGKFVKILSLHLSDLSVFISI